MLIIWLLLDNNDAQSWYLLGRCYMSQQKYSKAYEAYQQAVYRDGRNPTFWCSIGVLYYQINQYRDALDAYSRAIRLNPYISEVWYDLGTLVCLSFEFGFGGLATNFAPFCTSMNLAIIKQLTHLMPTNELLTLIPETCISKHVCNCYATDSPQDCQISTAPRYLKIYILNSTRILASGLLQGSNGVLQDLRQALLVKVLLLLLHEAIGDLLQLIIPSRNHQISMTSETGSDLLRHHLGNRAPARNN